MLSPTFRLSSWQYRHKASISLCICVLLVVGPLHSIQAEGPLNVEWTAGVGTGAVGLASGALTAAQSKLAPLLDILRQAQMRTANAQNHLKRLLAAGSLPTATVIAELVAARAALTAAQAAEKLAEEAVKKALRLGRRLLICGAAAVLAVGLSQGVEWVWTHCWDPICDFTSTTLAHPIYSPTSDEAVEALISELILLGTELELTKSDFEELGEVGTALWSFLGTGVRLFNGLVQGAAASTAGRYDEALIAASDLERELVAYAISGRNVATLISPVSVASPLNELQAARAEFETAMTNVRQNVNSAIGQLSIEVQDPATSPDIQDLRKVLELVNEASEYFRAAEETVQQIDPGNFGRLFGPDGLLPGVTIAEVEAFIDDCATIGAECLPELEVAVVERLMEAADVYSPSSPSVSPLIAAWDARGEIDATKARLFEPDGVLDIAEMLSRFANVSVAEGGSWLTIDLNNSPVTIEARQMLGIGPPPPPQPFFRGLGSLPGSSLFYSEATAVSGNGLAVVGQAFSTLSGEASEAFRWTSAAGMVGLGDLPGGRFFSSASAVSSDGSVIVGVGTNSSGSNEAFGWTSAAGMVGLGDLPGGGPFFSWANAVSSDGLVIVGIGTNSSGFNEAFRWTSAAGMVGLGDLPGGRFFSSASAVSSDGSVIVGVGTNSSGSNEAFRWTSAAGMVGLGFLPSANQYSRAFATSSDGSVIVGVGTNSSGSNEAFRWTSAAGMVGLGFLPSVNPFSRAFATSADGTVVVGESLVGSLSHAFIWDAANGMRDLRDVLVNDLNLTGWNLLRATGISSDGRTVVGNGVNPNGDREAWIATRLP